jgi:hypothetical protein
MARVSATGGADVADSLSSSAASEIGLKAGDRDAGLTVLLVLDGMDCKSCSNELPMPPWPSCELKSCCENVTGGWRSASKDGVRDATLEPC